MAATFNQCTFVGRIGKDPELNVTSDGTPVTKFSLAVDQPGKGKETMWLSVTAWRQLAEIIEKYGTKGRLVLVQGQLQMDTYKDKEGQNRQAVKVIANAFQLLDSKPKENGNGGTASDDDDPFNPF